MNNITALKLILKSCINEECGKRRDMTDKGSPVYGHHSEQAKAVLLIIEDEFEKKVRRYELGEDIYKIVPGLEDENEYDKM